MSTRTRAAAAAAVVTLAAAALLTGGQAGASNPGKGFDPQCGKVYVADGTRSLETIAHSHGEFPSQVLQVTWGCHFGTLPPYLFTYLDQGNLYAQMRKGTRMILGAGGG